MAEQSTVETDTEWTVERGYEEMELVAVGMDFVAAGMLETVEMAASAAFAAFGTVGIAGAVAVALLEELVEFAERFVVVL